MYMLQFFRTQLPVLSITQCRSALTHVRVSVSTLVCTRKLMMTSYTESSITWLL